MLHEYHLSTQFINLSTQLEQFLIMSPDHICVHLMTSCVAHSDSLKGGGSKLKKCMIFICCQSESGEDAKNVQK
jgi:hypothetical protein